MARLSLRLVSALKALLAMGAAALGWLLAATPALAHGGVTGAQDIIQDYGVLIFLIAVVLIGAGVLVWVMLSPQPESDTTEAPPGGAPS